MRSAGSLLHQVMGYGFEIPLLGVRLAKTVRPSDPLRTLVSLKLLLKQRMRSGLTEVYVTVNLQIPA